MLKEELLKKDKTYIVGVSGGMDSMALLDMLVEKKYNIIVCHFNYHFRQDSNIDQELVERYCINHHIPFYVRHGKEYHGNFEMEARILRYRFYEEIASQNNSDTVILGHHYNDHIETIIMQLQRKNTQGYLGIQERSYVCGIHVIRPLLDIKKEQLKTYCLNHNIEYHEDYTNNDITYTRNHVRHIDVHHYDIDKLYQDALMHNNRVYLKQQKVNQYINEYHRIGYLNYLEIEDVLDEVIYEMVKEYVYPPDISRALILEIKKQIYSPKPNIKISLPVNFVFIKKYNNIAVKIDKNDDTYSISYPEFKEDIQQYFSLKTEGHLNEGVYLSKEDFPITIRSVLPGDRIHTSGGTKKVKNLFIDRKIPLSERKTWPIVVNKSGEIVLIPHIAKNINYLYTKPNVFVLKLSNVSEVSYMHKDIKEILYSEEQIVAKCKELGKQIDEDYKGQEIILVALLKGSIPFMAELAKHIESDVKFDFMWVSSYSGIESKTLVVKQDLQNDVRGKNILIVEDILDTGKTLHNVKHMLEQRNARSVKIVTLLDKEEGRVYDMKADYSGFKIPNAFVVGFGLDFNESYRQLPYIGILKEECYKK